MRRLKNAKDEVPDFSFIIPSLNEGKYIGRCLNSINKQRESKEIIVVDSYSKDDTVKIAKKYGARVLYEGRKGPAVARNTGAKAANGRILVFPDADTKFDTNFLTKLKQEYENSKAGGGIFRLTFFDPRGYSDIFFFKVWNKIVKFLNAVGFTFTNGTCFTYRKDIFNKVGGFNSKLLTNEDHDLAIRISKYSRIRMFDITVYTTVRRLERLGAIKFLKLQAKATLNYFLFQRSLPEYWQ